MIAGAALYPPKLSPVKLFSNVVSKPVHKNALKALA